MLFNVLLSMYWVLAQVRNHDILPKHTQTPSTFQNRLSKKPEQNSANNLNKNMTLQAGAVVPSPAASVLKLKQPMYTDAAAELPSPEPLRSAEQWGADESTPREFPGAAGPSTEAQTGSASTSEVNCMFLCRALSIRADSSTVLCKTKALPACLFLQPYLFTCTCCFSGCYQGSLASAIQPLPRAAAQADSVVQLGAAPVRAALLEVSPQETRARRFGRSGAVDGDVGHLLPASMASRQVQGTQLMRSAAEGDSALLLGGDLIVTVYSARGLSGQARGSPSPGDNLLLE